MQTGKRMNPVLNERFDYAIRLWERGLAWAGSF